MTTQTINALSRASSAYLRSAMHQPIQWQEWGPEAFAQFMLTGNVRLNPAPERIPVSFYRLSGEAVIKGAIAYQRANELVEELRATYLFLFQKIIQYAKEKDIDLIIMGTHGHSGLAHVLLGSVTEKVVRKAPCPVLTVRHPEHEFVHP